MLFEVEVQLMDFAVENFYTIFPSVQDNKIDDTYKRKRTLEDSKIDPNKSIVDQFDLIKISDSDRFSCYFDCLSNRYKLKIKN